MPTTLPLPTDKYRGEKRRTEGLKEHSELDNSKHWLKRKPRCKPCKKSSTMWFHKRITLRNCFTVLRMSTNSSLWSIKRHHRRPKYVHQNLSQTSRRSVPIPNAWIGVAMRLPITNSVVYMRLNPTWLEQVTRRRPPIRYPKLRVLQVILNIARLI